jgi:alpha-L-arabinofuranosidase
MLRGDASAVSAETEVLGGGDVHEHNTFEQPDAVGTKKATASVSGKVVQFTLPPSSVTRLTITLS